jgi:hypothetical protein
MSHSKERKEKDCLNCSAYVEGRFCTVCGQENVETAQSLGQMAQHFVYDIFHFDGKFFSTLGLLLSQPGQVATEYARGRKASYLDPIRMYLFISTVMFFLLPVFSSVKQTLGNIHILASPQERLAEASRTYQEVQTNGDSTARHKLTLLLDTAQHLRLKKKSKDTANTFDFFIKGERYKVIPMTLEKFFPRGNWFENLVADKVQKDFEAQGGDFNQLMVEQAAAQQKMMPYVLFVSLPLFTALLSLFYRKRPGFYYSHHATFTLYHYILVFGLLVLTLFFQLLLKLVGVHTQFIFLPVVAITFIFLLFEMKRFYRQGWGITIRKFLAFSVLTIIMLSILFLFFSVLAIML